MDIDLILSELSDRFPHWQHRISVLRLADSPEVYPVDNDGSIIYYNTQLLQSCPQDARCFYFAQQLLHLQFSHFSRRQDRDPVIWKRACDAVVNSMLKAEGFDLPPEVFYTPEAEDTSAEELYELLVKRDRDEDRRDDASPEKIAVQLRRDNTGRGGSDGPFRIREIDDPGMAAVISGLSELLEPSMQIDFDWFPGDTVRDGVISYVFRPYPVSYAEILLDTSASVDSELLRSFVRGVMGLMKQDAVLRVGCFDTRFYGFQEIRNENDIQKLELKGFGGTDFEVAVNAFTGDAENCIILTDGFADMPEQRRDVVWVVYGSTVIHPKGGRVLYAKSTEEKEKHEVDFLIT